MLAQEGGSEGYVGLFTYSKQPDRRRSRECKCHEKCYLISSTKKGERGEGARKEPSKEGSKSCMDTQSGMKNKK